MKIWSILQWWNVCLVLCHRICWREWSELYIISANWYIIICYYFSFCLILSCAFSVDMQRSLLEGVDWTGQRELLQEKVSKLFWSYLDSRFVFFFISLCFCEISYCWGFCFYFVLFSRSLVCICFFLAESSNATCGPFSWRSYTSLARIAQVRSHGQVNSSRSSQTSLLCKRSS
jgi:hypothetical protein